jgi:hypothetical protein
MCPVSGRCKQESISSTFYTRIFRTKVFRAAFLFLEFGFEQIFVRKRRAENVDEIDYRFTNFTNIE